MADDDRTRLAHRRDPVLDRIRRRADYGTDTLDGELWVLGPSGAVRWRSLDLGTLDYSPVALGNGVLYSIDPLGLLLARNAATGAILKTILLGAPSFGGISIDQATVYAAVGTGPPPVLGAPDLPGSIVALR